MSERATGSDVSAEGLLIARAARGAQDAQRVLFERYREAAYRAAFRITGRHEDALDVVQDAFIRAFDRLTEFSGDASFKTWLLRIAANRALDVLRARKVRLATPLDAGSDDGPRLSLADGLPANRPDAGLEQHELAARLQAAIETLPLEQRTVFALYASGDLTYGNIAEVLGIPVGTVMSRLYHGRRRLAQLLPDLAPGGEAADVDDKTAEAPG